MPADRVSHDEVHKPESEQIAVNRSDVLTMAPAAAGRPRVIASDTPRTTA